MQSVKEVVAKKALGEKENGQLLIAQKNFDIDDLDCKILMPKNIL